MKVKPHHSLSFLLIILGLLTLLSLVFPKDGIRITDSYKLEFINFNDYLFPPKIEYADISHLIDTSNNTQFDTIHIQEFTIDSINNDTITDVSIDTLRVNADSLKHVTHKLQFADDNSECLYPVFEALKQLQLKQISKVRIMHYGDSQIEGDRITAILRGHLQKQFGGKGLGLFSAFEENSYAIPLNVKYDGNWERHTRYGLPDSMVNHKNYGMLASFSRFTHIPNDTLPISNELAEASFSFSPKEKFTYVSRSTFRNISIYAGNNKLPAFAEIYVDDSLVYMTGIDTTEKIKVFSWSSDKYLEEAKIKFMGQDSPDIYGISLEDSAGVYIDNIPLRGSAGTLFTQISKSHLQEVYSILNPKLFILEFGVNVAPNIVDSYQYYEKGMYKQLILLKQLCPDASIIVVGISDMSLKEGNYYVSYPNIEKIRDAQKSASFKAGCAFWDMYEAMGGHNSMPSWVFANPPLAQKDFTHFNYAGSKIIGDMFYNAFNHEFKKYLKRNK